MSFSYYWQPTVSTDFITACSCVFVLFTGTLSLMNEGLVIFLITSVRRWLFGDTFKRCGWNICFQPELLLKEDGVDILPKDLIVTDLCAALASLKKKDDAASPWKQSHVSAQSFFENKTGVHTVQYLGFDVEFTRLLLGMFLQTAIRNLTQLEPSEKIMIYTAPSLHS